MTKHMQKRERKSSFPHQTVTMGGGTGTYPVLKALRQLPTQITALVVASDSGGSTGRIRDEFGFVPVGDLRQSLAALTHDQSQTWISKLLLYRFEKGKGLKGHNLGNLILTALQDMTQTTTQALEIASAIFRLPGKVIPITEDRVKLKIHYRDGTWAIGEHLLDEAQVPKKAIDRVSLVPKAKINPVAKQTIDQAQTIIIGPGDYYASLMAVLVTPGVKLALKKFPGQIIYIVNLMTRQSQTHGMSVADHVRGIEKIIGRPLTKIIVNQTPVPPAILKQYQKAGDLPVVDDLKFDPRVIEADLINQTPYQTTSADQLTRSLLRHDADKLKQILAPLI